MTSGTKFAALVASVACERLPDEPLDLGSGFAVTGSARGADVSLWRELVGTERTNQIARANFWIWTERESDRMKVNDHENSDLSDRAMSFLWAMMLHEPPVIDHPWTITGFIDERIHVNGTAGREPVWQHHRQDVCVDVDWLREVAITAEAFHARVHREELSGVISRGIVALKKGFTEEHIDGAHLEFERALEGLLFPRNRVDFIASGNMVLRDGRHPDGDATQLLQDIYQARNDYGHCWPIELARVFNDLPQDMGARRDAAMALRDATYLFAARAYRHVLRDRSLTDRFRANENRAAIDTLQAYWRDVESSASLPPFVVDLAPEEWIAIPSR